ncbi:hypothetical protein [Deinococcus multiflagellatus]|uniref:Uncharacterized protein n=1 Tax=Deinococcus multiflagellatus TaxID=1656887 RepID=A0ABW1ZLN3_9DEIO
MYQSFVNAKANESVASLICSNIAVRMSLGEIAKKGGVFDIQKLVPADELREFVSMLRYSKKDGAAGNLAGNFTSGSDFGKDTRSVTGKAHIKFLTNKSVQIKLVLNITVNDAIDLCPGQPGDKDEQLLTVPLSRLEKSGMAGDIGFSVSYPYTYTELKKL